jgi:UDP-N-acetylglucosamine 2-epimerase (non-hydrolysing)
MFAPTDWALENIKNFNGIKKSTKYNTNIDSFWWAMNQKASLPKNLKGEKYYLLIVHRQEHVVFKKEWTKQIMEFVIKQADKKITCVILNHPLTIEIINSLSLKSKKIKIIDQLSYPQFLKVLQKAEFIATDSATIQQEAFYLGKPYLGLADYSVQTEGIGENAVLSKSNYMVIKDFINNYQIYQRAEIRPKKSPAKIIVNYLSSN